MPISRALYLTRRFGPLELRTRQRPIPGPGEILVKEVAVALNPVDWKTQTYGILVSDFPAILGHDGAGVVEAVGNGVTQFKKGDNVFHEGSTEDGGEYNYANFQEYVLVPAELAAKLPANITFDQAASLPVGIAAATIPFYSPSPHGVGIRAPWDGGCGLCQGQPILVLGGSTSVGQCALQFSKLTGFSPIISTASLRNADLLKSRGATHVIDRNMPASSIASEISRITTKPISLVYDAVASAETQQLGYDILADDGQIIIVSDPLMKEVPESHKKVVTVFANLHIPVNRALGCALAQHLPALLEAGDIIPHEVEIIPGGLNGIPSGLDKLKNNLVSGKKLIVRPVETA